MEAEFGTPARGRDDPLYDEGLAHVQAGEWAEALLCFKTLAQRYPGDPDVVRSLEQARFKARLDQQTRVKPKRGITIRWRSVLARALMLALLIVVAYFTVMFVRQTIAPAIEAQRARQAFAALVANCKEAAKGVDTAAARAACERVLQQDPHNQEVQTVIAGIAQKEKEQETCKQAEALITAGQYAEALQTFMDIQLLFPNSCQVTERINALRDRETLAGLFKQCQDAAEAANHDQVIDVCEQVRGRNTNYEAETVSTHLQLAYLRLGKQIVEQRPPQVEQLPLALDYFGRALQFDPKDQDAQAEQRLASQYLAGQQAFQGGRLDDAITSLSAVVELRPGYLGGLPAQQLYDAYLRRGDQYRDASDYSMAYRMYELATKVPGIDPASAINRRDSVMGFLTPTPTPTNTPTETPIPTATPYVPPGPTPLPTPAPPLATLRGKIVFYSEKEGEEGMWVMNPDGSQKRYLGPVTSKMQAEYDALRKKETYSPDGRFHLYSLKGESDQTVQVYYQGYDKDGFLVTQRVTNCSRICYDPVWAPDGSRIALVSPEWGSDDIWVINPDGKEWWDYTVTNPSWEWDKHPSWSPDSRKITYWSNREGTRQIFVIDADGKNLKKISGNAPWDEYDPLWIK